MVYTDHGDALGTYSSYCFSFVSNESSEWYWNLVVGIVVSVLRDVYEVLGLGDALILQLADKQVDLLLVKTEEGKNLGGKKAGMKI
eukprot:1649166-Amphidinium_carterae.1